MVPLYPCVFLKAKMTSKCRHLEMSYKNLLSLDKTFLKSQFVEMAVFNNKNVFQSTLLAEAATSNSSLDISAIKPNKDEFENKASFETPEKIFQRMKEKVLRNKQEQASRNSFLEPTQNESFTPNGAEERILLGPGKENEWLILKKPVLPDGFQGRVWGEGSKMPAFF